MEQQLAAYRRRKAGEFQENPSSSFMKWFMKKSNKVEKPPDPTLPEELHEVSLRPSTSTGKSPQYFDEASMLGDGSSRVQKWTVRALKTILWMVIWGLFIEIGFGSVYFVISLVFFVYLNTGTSPRTHDTPSAYSVFNPNCERIDGTTTAEQFEQELRYGAISVH